MKRFGILFILAIMLGVLVNCERYAPKSQEIRPDREKMDAYVRVVMKVIQTATSFPGEWDSVKLEKLLMKELELNGLQLSVRGNSEVKNTEIVYSDKVIAYKTLILAPTVFDNKGKYIEFLRKLTVEINNDNSFDNEEKRFLLDGVYFMTELTNALENYVLNNNLKEGEDWWNDWGKCAAGIIGEGILGGIGGVGVSAGGPVGGVVGGILGVIGGALHGASGAC